MGKVKKDKQRKPLLPVQKFVAVQDARSNEVVAKHILDSGKHLIPENLTASDGKEYQAYRVNQALIDKVIKSQADLGLDVLILSRRGENGSLSVCRVEPKKKKRKQLIKKKVKLASELL